MAKNGMGRPRDVTCEQVLAAFEEVDKPVATAPLLADVMGESKQAILRRLQELEDDEKVERWKAGGRTVVWWPSGE